MERVPYDEFSLFHENIAEYSLTASAQPHVQRIVHQLADGRAVSALKWGTAEPQMVFVHGG